jgi:predicted nucleic acid-binding protein
VLPDEREGRKAARRRGLVITGVVGILLRGAEDGSVDVETELDRLRNAGFWISDDLYSEILERGRTGG